MVKRVLRVKQVLRVRRVLRDPMALPVNLALLAPQGQKGMKVQQERKETQVLRAQREIRDLKAPKE